MKLKKAIPRFYQKFEISRILVSENLFSHKPKSGKQYGDTVNVKKVFENKAMPYASPKTDTFTIQKVLSKTHHFPWIG